jgi:transposase-like protein
MSPFMPLSNALLDIPLTRPCPHCGHKLEKMGNWFSSIAHYECAKCRRELRMTYEAKLALFEAYGTVSKKPKQKSV